jgi:hypothetical protein
MARRATRRRVSLALAFALLAGVMASCAPTTGTGGGTSAQQQFCDFWNSVTQTPPTSTSAVLVKTDVVALADTTSVTGSACTDPSANVALGGAVLAQGQEVPSQQNVPDSSPVAAVTGSQIASGSPVLDNLSVKTLSASIGVGGITVRGTVAVTLSGTTSTIGFTGTLADLSNWSVTLSSAGLTIPGITTSPVTFSGTLSMIKGVPSLALTALASSVTTGDITVTGATLKVAASPSVGVAASVAGSIKVGPSTASGTVYVQFDKSGGLVAANADIAAHLVGTEAGGKKIDLTGTVKFQGNATQTSIAFTGSGVVGDLVVNAANGSLSLATNKATFMGVLDVAQGANSVRFDGSIVWDGVTAYTPFLTLQGAGQISGTLNDGTAVSVDGSLSTTVVGGEITAEVDGNFTIGTLKATGSALVDVNGPTTTLNITADLVDAGFTAKLQGAVIITDGMTEMVSLDAAVDGSVTLGDATLTGANLHIGSTYGNPLDVSFSGGIVVGSSANLTASVDASFGPSGQLITMTGTVTGTLHLDSWDVSFSGSVNATIDQITLSGSGTVSLINFPLGITFNGTFTSSLTTPSWSLNGTGAFRIASIQLASARLSLSQGVGMKATRVGFYFDIIGIPTYFEGDFYMKPTGGCSKVVITGGSFLAKPLLLLVLPGVIGCPVS